MPEAASSLPYKAQRSITLKEAAQILGYGLTKTKELVQVGLIPHHHNGRRVLLRPEDVTAYRDAQIREHMQAHRPRIHPSLHRVDQLSRTAGVSTSVSRRSKGSHDKGGEK